MQNLVNDQLAHALGTPDEQARALAEWLEMEDEQRRAREVCEARLRERDAPVLEFAI